MTFDLSDSPAPSGRRIQRKVTQYIRKAGGVQFEAEGEGDGAGEENNSGGGISGERSDAKKRIKERVPTPHASAGLHVSFEEPELSPGKKSSKVALKRQPTPGPNSSFFNNKKFDYAEELNDDDDDTQFELMSAPVPSRTLPKVASEVDSASHEFQTDRQVFLQRIADFEETVRRQSMIISQLKARAEREEE